MLSYLKWLGGRKYTLAVACYLGTLGLTSTKIIDAETYSTVTIAILAGYFTGNVLQKLNLSSILGSK